MKTSLPMVRRSSLLIWSTLFVGLSGCSGAYKRSVQLDLTQGRLTNLALSEKATGQRELLLFSLPRRNVYLEGYITGMVTDYAGNPIPGVIVRAALKNAPGLSPENVGSAAAAAGQAALTREEVSGGPFDAGISDSQGIYRVRFSLPVADGKVDAMGRLLYNPSWEQEKAALGRTYQPQVSETDFRLYYDASLGLASFSDGVAKVIVQPVAGETKVAGPAKPQVQPAAARPVAPAPAPVEDLFRGFGLGP